VYSKPEKDELVLTFARKKIGGNFVLNTEADKIEFFPLKNFLKIRASNKSSV
jgi:hypothetical protein